jgi:hypothetical protein
VNKFAILQYKKEIKKDMLTVLVVSLVALLAIVYLG